MPSLNEDAVVAEALIALAERAGFDVRIGLERAA